MAITLEVVKRESRKASMNKKLRLNGQVPGVVYGKGKDNFPVAVNNLELIKLVRDEGRNAIFSLSMENEQPINVMLHEYQIDPIKNELVHVDFYMIDMAEEIDVQVSVRVDGEAIGTKDGGVLQQPLYELAVRAKPNNIPDEIVVDVSDLKIGDVLAVADLPVNELYQFLDDGSTTIVTIVPADTMQDIEQAPDENAEPELVDASSDKEE